MSRIESILTRARDSLADHAKQRWTDARLLRLVDEAHKDIARHSKLLKGTYDIALSTDIHTYELPDDVHLITRAAYDNCEIALVSYDTMDEQAKKDSLSCERHTTIERRSFSPTPCWELDSAGYVDRLVYDNRNMGEIRVYPIPDCSLVENDYTFQQAGYLDHIVDETNSPFGILTTLGSADALLDDFGVTVSAEGVSYIVTDLASCNGIEAIDEVTLTSPYGVLSELTDSVLSVAFHGDEQLGVAVSIDGYNTDSVHGVITSLYDPAIASEEFKSAFGPVTGVNETDATVKIWYVRTPATLEFSTDSLELPPMYDTAIRLYVVGNAFLDDNDAANRQKGTDTLGMYDRELNLAQTVSSADGARNATTLTTSYRGPFE